MSEQITDVSLLVPGFAGMLDLVAWQKRQDIALQNYICQQDDMGSASSAIKVYSGFLGCDFERNVPVRHCLTTVLLSWTASMIVELLTWQDQMCTIKAFKFAN